MTGRHAYLNDTDFYWSATERANLTCEARSRTHNKFNTHARTRARSKMKDQIERIRRVAEKETREITEESLPRARRASTSVLRGHEERVERACVLADGKGVVTACGDHSVRVYSLSGGDPIHTLDMHDDWVTDVSALGEDIIASVGCDGIVVTWECGTGKLIEKIKIRDHDHHQAVITEAGWGKLVVGTSEGELHIIEHTAGRGLRYNSRIRRAHSRKIQTVAYCNGLLVVGSDDRCLSIWEGRKCLTRLYHNDSIKKADINEERILTMMNDEIRIYERNTWKLLRVLRGLHGYDDITCCVLLSNEILLSVGHDGKILFTRISDAVPLLRYRVDIDRPDGISVAPNGRVIVTSQWAHRACILEIQHNKEVITAMNEYCSNHYESSSEKSKWLNRAVKPLLLTVATTAATASVLMLKRALLSRQ